MSINIKRDSNFVKKNINRKRLIDLHKKFLHLLTVADLDEDTNPVSNHNSGGCNFRRGGRREK